MEAKLIVYIYQFFAWIDYIVYSFAAVLVRIILLIANKDDFFTPTQINNFVGRVYVVVGVLVLFKLVISAVQYMINPDVLDDKEKGMAGILRRVAISLVLIVATPTMFNFLMHMQTSIVNTMPKIIFGNNVTDADELTKDTASNLSFTVLSSFISQNAGKGAPIGSQNGIHDLESFAGKVVEGCDGSKSFLQSWAESIFTGFGDGLSTWGSWIGITTKDGAMAKCHYNYKIIISTVAGVFLCYVLLSMTLDIAMRFIKLGVIRMLAPVPIVGYIFDKDKLSKFVKTTGTVYADLFIRLGIVYFIVFFISEIIGSNAEKNISVSIINFFGLTAGESNIFFNAAVNIATIFGLLMFAKNAPKFISDLLGLPDIGSGEMADMFKPVWQRAGGFAAAGAAIGAWRNAKEYGEANGLRIRRALSAGAHATVTRLKDAASGKSLEESYKSAKETAMARTNRNLEYANRFPNRKERRRQLRHERFDAYTGVMTGGKKDAATIEAANKAIGIRSDSWSRAEEKVLEKNAAGYSANVDITDSTGRVHNYTASQLLSRIAELEGGARPVYRDELRLLKEKRQSVIDMAKTEFIQKSISGRGDGKLRNKFAEDVFGFIRTGGDQKELDTILKNKVIEDVYNPATRRNENIEIDIVDAANRIAQGQAVDDMQAAAIAKYIQGYEDSNGYRQGIEVDAGAIRVRTTQKQTSEPKSS